MKFLIEKRNALVEEINNIFVQAETEKRALTDEEQETFTTKTNELKALDKTIEAKKEARSLTMMDEEPKTPEEKEEKRSVEETEKRAFETLIRENRAGEMTKTDNGAVIPTSIANQIIDRVKQIAPLYALATKFNVKGKLQFPVGKDAITTAYGDEFTALTSSKVGFDAITLDDYLVGALSKISN